MSSDRNTGCARFKNKNSGNSIRAGICSDIDVGVCMDPDGGKTVSLLLG